MQMLYFSLFRVQNANVGVDMAFKLYYLLVICE